jgi:hypothetical protein
MAYTAPYTAAANDSITSAHWNAGVRDNMAATETSLANNQAVTFFASTGANAITTRSVQDALTLTGETTTLTQYTDLATAGPHVTLTTGTAAMVFITAQMQNTGADAVQKVSFAVSGASTVAASDDWAIILSGVLANSPTRLMSAHRITTLTAGSNTFTMKYAVSFGTGTFARREICVIPL